MSLVHDRGRDDGATIDTTTKDLFVPQAIVAELLQLSARTLERLRCEGGGPCYYKIGRRVLYRRADVLAWANAQRRTSTSDQGTAA
jgi:hypothetical protein